MKNIRRQLKLNEENNTKFQNKFKKNPKITQFTRENKIKNDLYKEKNSLIHLKKEKDSLISQKKINKKLFLLPKLNANTERINTEIDFHTIDNDLNIDNISKHKVLLFPKTNKNNDEIIFKEKNSSVENDHNRIYVHKKLKNINNRIINTSRNEKNIGEIQYRNTFCQTNRIRDYYSKLILFSNKPKFFRKKNLSDAGNRSNDDINNKMKNVKYLNRALLGQNKESFFKFQKNENQNNKENIFNKTDDGNINNSNNDFIDDIENRLDNINDYINIYSINNNKNEQNDNINKFEEEDKIIIKKKNNNIRHRNIFINTNNNIENNSKKSEENNTININKNIIINKKIILFPEDKNNCSKTSYGFFNTYSNKFKNIETFPYSNTTGKYINQNINYKDNNENIGHSRTKPAINNFVYKKKSFISPSPKKSRYINYFTENNNIKSNKNIINTNNLESYQMSNTANNFYDSKKSDFYNNIGLLSNKAFNNYNNKFCGTKGRLQNYKNDINYKYKLDSSNDKIKENNNNPNILIINEKSDSEDIKSNSENKYIKVLSIMDICKYLEAKLKIILNRISKYQNCEKDCYEYIHFYFENNFYQEKINYLNNIKNREILINSTKIEILNLFLCYDILCSKKFNKACILLKAIISLLYDNFFLLLILILRNSNENKNKDIFKYLNNIINEFINKKNIVKKNIINENKIIEIIEKNSNETINYYKMIIESLYPKNFNYNEKNYYNKNQFFERKNNINSKFVGKNNTNKIKIKDKINHFFNNTYKKTQDFSFEEFISFFYTVLSHTKNEKKAKKDKNTSVKQYILPPIKANYKYSLILNLDETLVYRKNTLVLRPYLNEFLHEMKKLYEIIIFSDTSKEYTNFIVDIIQQKEKYFSYVLNNKYITYDNKNDKIKDLSLLGRKLTNIVVVDSMDKFYKKNKDNLICIKGFYGDINNDKNTLKILSIFLNELIINSEKVEDIRISLNNLKYKIYPKVINSLN